MSDTRESETQADASAGAHPFSTRARISSFAHAFRGLAEMVRSEHNTWIHALATGAVLALGFAFSIDRTEWLAIVLAIAWVWTAEAFNTAIETLCNVVSPDHDERIKRVKDVAAGAVLVSAIGALIVGLIVFLPRLLWVWANL